jgi:hypothetical protein
LGPDSTAPVKGPECQAMVPSIDTEGCGGSRIQLRMTPGEPPVMFSKRRQSSCSSFFRLSTL